MNDPRYFLSIFDHLQKSKLTDNMDSPRGIFLVPPNY